MSLVNEMLRDLDARMSADVPELDGLEPVKLSSSRNLSVPLLLAVIAGVLALTFAAYQLMSRDEVGVKEVFWQSLEMPELAAAERSLPVDQDVRAVDATSAAYENGPVSTSGQQQVLRESGAESLLAKAEEALLDDRLTQPAVNNAYAYLRHALLIEPGNEQALSGINRIHDRYEDLFREALAQPNRNRAEELLQRARFVVMPNDRLVLLENALSDAKREASASTTNPSDSRAPVDGQVDVTATAAVTDEQPPAAPLQDVRSSIAPSWRSQEQAAITRAQALLQDGRHPEAITELQAVVDRYPRAERAAVLLFETHLEAGDVEAAKRLQLLISSETTRRYFEAKLLSAAGNHSAALQQLEGGRAQGAAREAYTALQAALYQKNGQSQQAMRLYQQLVDMNNRQAHYWLGLGVSAEAAGERTQALKAFVAANQLAPANPAVANYIKQRIEALSP